MDINDRITDTLALAERLIKLLDQENDLLKSDDTTALAEMVGEKTNLAMAFEKAYKAIEDNQEELKEADEGLREDMRDIAERLSEVMVENGKLLNVAIDARQTVLNLFREAAQQGAPNTGAYSASGVVDDGRVDKKKRASVAFDQSL